MRSTSTTIAILAALPSIYAISLADFQPYLTALPSACESVYTQQVAGCKNTDFTSGKGCSTACISGLQALVAPIQLVCASANVFNTNNVVNTFITSDGVKSLCPNAPAATVQTTTSLSTSSTPSPTSTNSPSTTATPAIASQGATTSSSTSSTTASSSDAPVVATTSSASSSSSTAITSSNDIVSSTSSASAASSSSAATTLVFIFTSSASAAPSSTASSTTGSTSAQNINNSGGGSPFDTTSMASGPTTSSAYSFALFLSALLAAYIL